MKKRKSKSAKRTVYVWDYGKRVKKVEKEMDEQEGSNDVPPYTDNKIGDKIAKKKKKRKQKGR